MSIQKLDYLFPFIVFFYGILLVFVLENESLDKLARERLPTLAATMRSHKTMAWICFFVGGLWSIQNIWLT